MSSPEREKLIHYISLATREAMELKGYLSSDYADQYDDCLELMDRTLILEICDLTEEELLLLIDWDEDCVLEACNEYFSDEELLQVMDSGVAVDCLTNRHPSEYQQDTIKKILDYADEIRPYLIN